MATFSGDQDASVLALKGHVHSASEIIVPGQDPIDPQRIGTETISTLKIADGSVTTEKLDNNTITTLKLNSSLITLIGDAVPIGVIVVWSGAADSIPAGWHLCDGQDGTPDLRGRFVLGSNPVSNRNNALSVRTLNTTGGSEDHVLLSTQMPAHSHAITLASAGGHSHTVTMDASGAHTHTGRLTGGAHRHDWTQTTRTGGGGRSIGQGSSSSRLGWNWRVQNSIVHELQSGHHSHSVSITENTGGHTHATTITDAEDHTHAITVASTGSSAAHENMPPFFVLAYIQKKSFSV